MNVKTVLKLSILSLLLTQALFAATTVETASTSARPEIGLTMQYLVPTHMPGFETPITTFGPHVGIPFLGQTLQLQGVYGSGETISLFNLEAAYRYSFPTPFFTSFLFAGAHYMHYGYLQDDHSFVGPLTGFGFYFPMDKDFSMGLGMKLYLPEKIMLSFGGSFAFLL